MMNREVRVGLMFALSLGLLVLAIYYLGNIKEMVTYKIQFDKVIGLSQDSPVQFRGVPIGRVKKIVLADADPSSAQVPIIVHISVHRSARAHIRTSTIADIRSVGVLGDKSILLLTKDYAAEELEQGGFIQPAPKTLDVDKLIEQGEDLVTDAAAITTNLRNILEQMGNEEGPFQTLIGDEQLAKDMKGTISSVLSYLEQEQSLLNLLMKDDAFAAMIKEKTGQTLANAEGLSEDFKNGDGLLPMLMQDPQFKEDVTTKVNDLLDTTNRYAKSLEDGRGLAYKLTQDEAYAERVAANLEKASAHLASILEKVDKGEGSASMIINDPSLYEGIYDVVYGLQHSGLSKWYIQRKQKKGEALRAKSQSQGLKERP